MLKIGEYDIDKTSLISRNRSSDIMQACSKQNKYAAKVVLKGLGKQAVEKFRQDILNERYEARMSKAVHSVYTPRYVNYLETEKYAVLFMELAGKSLKSITVRSQQEVDEVRTIFREILLGLHNLHQLKVAHRNIQPGNIMISQNRKVKIIDYQNAVFFNTLIDGDMIASKQITGFQAPQILSQQPHDSKVDIWSAGVLFHWMLFGQLPFSISDNSTARSLLKTIQSICVGGFKLHQNFFGNQGSNKGRHYRNISRTIESFIRQMLQIDPSKRPDTEQLLCHPIFQQKFKMKLFIYDRGNQRKLDSNLSNSPSFCTNQTQISTKHESVLTNNHSQMDYQKYLLYKFPMSCLQYLIIYENDIMKKQVKLFRCYLLCISMMYCFSLFRSLKQQKKQSLELHLKAVQNDYFSIKSQFQLEMYEFKELYPYQQDEDISKCKNFDCIKYKYRSLCQKLAKSCIQIYNQSKRGFDQRSLHLKLAFRIILLSVINRLFTHQRCKKMNMMKQYWQSQQDSCTRLQTLNAFIEGVGYEKSNQYINQIMKIFD